MSERMSDLSQNRCQIECQIKYLGGDHSKKVICELYADMFVWPVSTRSWNFSTSLWNSGCSDVADSLASFCCFLDVQMQAYVHRYCYDVPYLYINIYIYLFTCTYTHLIVYNCLCAYKHTMYTYHHVQVQACTFSAVKSKWQHETVLSSEETA